MGKHGNLEWLPGKASALSESCFPEAALGPLPHLYPFIVNDPGEGTQAKRRAQAVIVDHLTPPLTRAETYGALRDLEALVDEYYEAAGVDPRRIAHLRGEILSLTQATGLDLDAGATEGDDADSRLRKLDAYLCELKESQIRDGLHVFGQSPEGRLARDLTVALARVPRGDGQGRRRLADPGAGAGSRPPRQFDPLDCDMAAPWPGPRPEALALADDPWRTNGDTVERLELLAAALVDALPDAPAAAGAVSFTADAGAFLPRERGGDHRPDGISGEDALSAAHSSPTAGPGAPALRQGTRRAPAIGPTQTTAAAPAPPPIPPGRPPQAPPSPASGGGMGAGEPRGAHRPRPRLRRRPGRDRRPHPSRRRRLRPGRASGPPHRARRPLPRPRPLGRAHPRPARRAAHGAQLLLRRQPRRAHPRRLGAGLELRHLLIERHAQDHGDWPRALPSPPGAPPTCAPAATTSPRRSR